jgi:hypothetical protein
MAISISTYTLPVGFSRADVLTKLETVFADLGFHAPAISGLVSSLQGTVGGGGVGSVNTYYSSIQPKSTSGTGKNATFDIERSNGNIYRVRVCCPGQDYKTGDTVTIDAGSIGGAAQGATDMTITLTASNTSYGGPTTYFATDYNRNDPWAVMRMEMDETKRYGFTYRGISITANNYIEFRVGSSFNPQITDNNANLGWGAGISFKGTAGLDCIGYTEDTRNRVYDGYSQVTAGVCWSSNSFPLDIIVYKSTLDPDFAVISFYQPTLPSTNLTGNTFATFSLNKYPSDLWDLDNFFQGGVSTFFPISNINVPPGLRIYWEATGYFSSSYYMNRMAEFGFGRCQTGSGEATFLDNYYSNIFYGADYEASDIRIYSRKAAYDNPSSVTTNTFIPASTDYRAVIKGLPVSSKVAPIPYYFPDEFVLIDFVYNQPSQNIQPGDTVTVSPTEIYTVITGGYVTDRTNNTWGMLFAARTT